MTGQDQIVVYQPNETMHIDVRFDSDTVWLTQAQLCELFQRDQSTIARHIKCIFSEGELEKQPNMHFLHISGVIHPVAYYSLDVIISVGYRVKSVIGTKFRQWAISVIKQRLLGERSVECRMTKLEQRMDSLELEVKRAEPLPEKVYCEGQQFDAYTFFCDLIRKAKRRVYLIDNYVNDAVLTMLDKRAANVLARIYTGKYSKQFQLDLTRHNEQYPPIEVVNFPNVHDRFLIVDDMVWIVGASLKDAGKKKFAVIRTNFSPTSVLPLSFD